MIRPFGIALVTAIACTGCATSSAFQTRATDTATLIFSRGFRSGFGVAAAQSYYVSETERCTDSRLAAALKKNDGGDRSVKVAARQAIIVSARTEYFYTADVKTKGGDASPKVKDNSCDDALAFIPVLGATYRVSHDAAFGKTCRLEIVDAATRKPVATEKVGGRCPPG